jgi:hypothetical protein
MRRRAGRRVERSLEGGLRPTSRLALIRLPRRDEQCWPLNDRYVELVWVETLGVTALAVARRLALLMTGQPPAHATSLAALATPLHVPPGKVLAALRRLHNRLVVWREGVGVIGLSGYARSLDDALVTRLSPYGTRHHAALTAAALRSAIEPSLLTGHDR